MNESSVRAERYDREVPARPAYIWAVPQKPVTVRIGLELLTKLEREAVESYRSLTSRGSEIGGVLWGTISPGNPALVEVEACEAVACDYTIGPLYRLGEPELVRLDQVLKQRRGGKLEPVGFYRSHTRKGLLLDAEDVALFDSRFGGPHQVALLIHPAKKGSAGAFFIRENGAVRGEGSYLEFPIEAEEKDAAAGEGGVAGPRAVAAAPAMPAASRPVARAQIVPIATRREILPMAPPAATAEAAASEPEASLAHEPEAAPVAQTARLAGGSARPTEAQVPAPSPAEPLAAAAAAVEKAVDTTPKLEAPGEPGRSMAAHEPAAPPPAERPEPRRPRKWLWLAIGAAIPMAVAAGLVLSSGMLTWWKPAIPVTPPEAGLALRIERNAADILLTWNRDADAIRRATKAVLSISDGTQQENVEMDLSQLRTGSIVYSPVTSDVVFRMQVSTSGQAEPVSETVRVLRTRPSPMPEANPGAAAPAAAEQKPAATLPGGQEAGSADAGDPALEGKEPLAQPVKTFHPESLAQRLRPARPADLPDAPMVAAAPPAALPALNLGGIVANPVAPPPSAPKAEVPKKVAAGGQVQPAKLIRRVNPEYPRMAQETGAGGTVEVVATIGADGRVKNVSAVSGNPLLRQAALDAVRQWIYRPTMLNGQPVESQTHVMVEFRSNR